MNRWVCGLLLAVLATGGASARVWYVDRGNTSLPRDGSSWSRAFTTLQEGINAATSGDEVWVAEGNYGESRSATGGSLILKPNVHVYGGFAGTEIRLDQRDPASHPTTIDGSRSRGGAKAYHVVVGATGVRLDGFTVVGGLANGGSLPSDSRKMGGGLYNSGVSSLVVANCTFSGHQAETAGGAAYNVRSTVRYENCTFSGNRAGDGGAMQNDDANVTYVRCLFSNNQATLDGGAVDNVATSPSFTACAFYGNRAGTGGAANGGAVCTPGLGTHFTNCVFQDNESRTRGGAVYGTQGGTFMNCTFRYNDSASGASLYCHGGNWQVTNCILWDGAVPEIVRNGGTLTVRYSNIEDSGYTGNGNIRAAPLFVGGHEAPPRLKPGSPGIDQGTSANAPTTDILGTPRPVGSAVDMGAYEGATCILRTALGSLAGSGTIDPAPGPSYYYRQGDPATLRATPAAGWRFGRWEEGSSSWTQNPVTVTMSRDRTMRALFIRQYTLTVQVVGNGTIDPGPGTYVYDSGTIVELSVTPASGWTFDHWEGALTGSTTPGRVTMSADRTVTAVFKRRFTLTMAASSGGDVTPAPGDHVYTEGTLVNLTAVPHAGHRFDHWEGDASGSDPTIAVTMDGDKSIRAVFAAINYHVLSIGTIGLGGTNPAAGPHSYEENEPVQITATPAQNWRFDRWEGDVTGSANPLTLVMDRDWSVTAVFERIPLDILSATPMAALPLGGTSVNLSVQSWTSNCRVTVGDAECRIASTSGQGTVQVRAVVPPLPEGIYALRVTDTATQEQAVADDGFVYTTNPFDTGLPPELNAGLEFDDGVSDVTTYGRRIFRQATGFPNLHYESPEGIVVNLPATALPSAADGAFLLLRVSAQPEALFPGAIGYPDAVRRSGVVDWHLIVRESGTNIYEVVAPLPQALEIGLPLSPGPTETLVPAGFETTLDGVFAAVPPDPPEYGDTGSDYSVVGHLATVQSRLYGAYILFGERPAEDINLDGVVDASDIQLTVNAALDHDIGGLDADIDDNGRTDAFDLQRVINVVLGFW